MTLHGKIDGVPPRLETDDGSGRASDDGKVEDDDNVSGGGGTASTIKGEDSQAEGATRVRDVGMACANASASAASSVTAAFKQAGDIRV